AVAEIVRLVALNLEELTAGAGGLLITTLPQGSIAGHAINWESKIPFCYLAAGLNLFAMGLTYAVSRSRLWASLTAGRQDVATAEATGIDTVRTRVVALVLSAFVVGLAGGFYALYFRYIDPDAVFAISLSVEMVFIAVVGGLATTAGPIVGAVVLVT